MSSPRRPDLAARGGGLCQIRQEAEVRRRLVVGRQLRLAVAADLFTKPENGRFTRTFVNRIWKKLMGRGIVEPVDDMDAQPFDADDAELTGDAIRLADGLPYSEAGAAAFAASQTGVLIFRNDPQRQAVPGGAPAPLARAPAQGVTAWTPPFSTTP